MKTRLAATTAMLSLAITANAQITKNRKYDWGWSYKLEMPETGLKCEFPEKPKVTTLAYGYMTAASYKDELYVAAKLENPDAYDIACRTEEFTTELNRVYKLPISDVNWNTVESKNGHLSLSGDASNKYAQFHIDAIATNDVLTIFIYSNHDELSIPGHFFANSYSVDDIAIGNLQYLNEEKTKKRAKILDYTNGISLVRLENTPVTVEWPDIPSLEVNRHESDYRLSKNGAEYSTKVLEIGPEVSYAFFSAFVNKEHKKLGSAENVTLTSDGTDVALEIGGDSESYFRKMTYTSPTGNINRFYAASGNKIFIQELRSAEMANSEIRFLQTFEQSLRNEYDTRTFATR